jgi:hypothetical protein
LAAGPVESWQAHKGGEVVVYQGQVLTVEQMLDRAAATPHTPIGVGVGIRHTAADNARVCRDLLATGDTLDECWRFGILQTLDDYTSTLRRGGVALAAQVFAPEPPATGSAHVDAAFAALAVHLASRDGWDAPTWTSTPSRFAAEPWYPAVPVMWHPEADQDSPPAFRSRGIFITSRSLARA